MTIKTANHLYELRKKSNLSQEDVANRIGVSRQAVSKWERAEAQPDTDNLIELAKLYNVSLDELVQINDIDNEDLDSEKELRTDELNEENKNDDNEKHIGNLLPLLMVLATVAFLLLGFIGHYWSWGWLTYLLAICISSFVEAILNKKPGMFAYPVLVTAIYLFLGLAYPGIWHPTWVLFITIPAYYTFVGIFEEKKKK